MNQKLKDLIAEISSDEGSITKERIKELDEIASIITIHLQVEDTLDIMVVCTHNSRRSQLGEAWINVLTNHLGIEGIRAFSGGMEVTAFNHRMVSGLRSDGFDLQEIEKGENPKYTLSESTFKDQHMFSKVYNDSMNPQSGFMALMVCGHADENCPIVHGMKYRIPLRYKDPKEFDDTKFEKEAYNNKIIEIGREIYYLLSKVK